MRFVNTSLTVLSALALSAASAVAQNGGNMAAMQGGAASKGVDRLPPLTLAPGESPEKMYTPARIAAVATISNINEIDPSRLALTNSQNPAVQAYARDMVNEHTMFEQQLRAMLDKKKMVEEDNALSLQLKRNAKPTLDSLQSKQGVEFDKAYVLQQIESHDVTLNTLDTSLIPLATDPEMKAMLQNQVRPAVVRHLARIKQIHDQMMMASR